MGDEATVTGSSSAANTSATSAQTCLDLDGYVEVSIPPCRYVVSTDGGTGEKTWGSCSDRFVWLYTDVRGCCRNDRAHDNYGLCPKSFPDGSSSSSFERLPSFPLHVVVEPTDDVVARVYVRPAGIVKPYLFPFDPTRPDLTRLQLSWTNDGGGDGDGDEDGGRASNDADALDEGGVIIRVPRAWLSYLNLRSDDSNFRSIHARVSVLDGFTNVGHVASFYGENGVYNINLSSSTARPINVSFMGRNNELVMTAPAFHHVNVGAPRTGAEGRQSHPPKAVGNNRFQFRGDVNLNLVKVYGTNNELLLQGGFDTGRRSVPPRFRDIFIDDPNALDNRVFLSMSGTSTGTCNLLTKEEGGEEAMADGNVCFDTNRTVTMNDMPCLSSLAPGKCSCGEDSGGDGSGGKCPARGERLPFAIDASNSDANPSNATDASALDWLPVPVPTPPARTSGGGDGARSTGRGTNYVGLIFVGIFAVLAVLYLYHPRRFLVRCFYTVSRVFRIFRFRSIGRGDEDCRINPPSWSDATDDGIGDSSNHSVGPMRHRMPPVEVFEFQQLSFELSSRSENSADAIRRRNPPNDVIILS